MQETFHLWRYVNSEPKGFVHLTFSYEKAGEIWVGECLELGTATEAASIEQAKLQLAEAVKLQLDQMDEMGYIDGFLREHNIPLYPVKTLENKNKQSVWIASEPELQRA